MLTSILVSSLAEIRGVAEEFSGPVLCIPFGAEDTTTPCCFVNSITELTLEDVEALIEHAYPGPEGSRVLHIVQAPLRFSLGPKGPMFYRIET
ncbi:MAG: hypothetical protein JWN49_360 [Parcubacteria group bacterium]|nr:hypothetical protein [Parcubacteria group bacterium]